MDNDNNYNNVNADASGRRSRSRVPHRRDQEQNLNGVDMAHIAESLEDSIAVYEHNNYTPKYTGTGYVRPEAPMSDPALSNNRDAADNTVNAAYESRIHESVNRSSASAPERRPADPAHTGTNNYNSRKT